MVVRALPPFTQPVPWSIRAEAPNAKLRESLCAPAVLLCGCRGGPPRPLLAWRIERRPQREGYPNTHTHAKQNTHAPLKREKGGLVRCAFSTPGPSLGLWVPTLPDLKFEFSPEIDLPSAFLKVPCCDPLCPSPRCFQASHCRQVLSRLYMASLGAAITEMVEDT